LTVDLQGPEQGVPHKLTLFAGPADLVLQQDRNVVCDDEGVWVGFPADIPVSQGAAGDWRDSDYQCPA
jgi:hypothetical protein